MSALHSPAKRTIDVLGAAIGMVALAPILLPIALLVWRSLGAPVLFRQVRPGLHGRPFELLKFRTMTDARDATGALRPDAERLTGFGKWLRGTSLDELPELINVLRGDMSLVGPRPLLVEYLDHYSAEQARRHDVRPGITGWAAVNGRNATSWERRLALDVWYVDHWSLWLDLKILFMTVAKVLKREGISAEGHATMPRFDQDLRHQDPGRGAPAWAPCEACSSAAGAGHPMPPDRDP
ncbi:MAG TPA: sugar transferase [Geminicoccaceae bacterium]|nr:sugar transferase [Geminicoccaceae bacterium]